MFVMVYIIVFVSLPVLVSPPGDELFRSALLRVLLGICTVGLVVGAAIHLDKRPLQGYGLEITHGWCPISSQVSVLEGRFPQ